MNVLDLFFPKTCYGCKRRGSYLCPSCQIGLVSPKFTVLTDELDGLWSLAEYQGLLKQMIQKLKYRWVSDVAELLAKLVTDNWDLVEAGEVVSFVPSHPQRQKQRGFNQAELLAREVAKQKNLHCLSLLTKIRQTQPQVGLNSRQRLINLTGAFVILPDVWLPETVWLVDDVATTGATLNECAKVLKMAGVERVFGLTLARSKW